MQQPPARQYAHSLLHARCRHPTNASADSHPPVSGWLLGTMPSMPGGSSRPPTCGVSPVDSSGPPPDSTPAATTAGVGAGAGGRPGGSDAAAPAAVPRCCAGAPPARAMDSRRAAPLLLEVGSALDPSCSSLTAGGRRRRSLGACQLSWHTAVAQGWHKQARRFTSARAAASAEASGRLHPTIHRHATHSWQPLA